MAQLATGSRLQSTVCNTQVMVIKAPEGDIEVTCGGAPMVDAGAEAASGGSVDPEHAEGTAIGKRYVNEDGSLELLCVKAGEGSLAIGGVALTIKGAKKLPWSD